MNASQKRLAWAHEVLIKTNCHRMSMPFPSVFDQLHQLNGFVVHENDGVSSVSGKITVHAFVADRVNKHQVQVGKQLWKCTEPVESAHPLNPHNGPWLVLSLNSSIGLEECVLNQAVALPILSSNQLLPVNNAYERAVLFRMADYFAKCVKWKGLSLQVERSVWSASPEVWIVNEVQQKRLKLLVRSDNAPNAQPKAEVKKNSPITIPFTDAVEKTVEFDAVGADLNGTWEPQLEKLLRAISLFFATPTKRATKPTTTI